ncbi:MAG: nuclear transport factor 2 family protein [Pseudomonadota bacterium]
MSTVDVLRAYGMAWAEPDADKRVKWLEQCWADDGVYQDPSSDVTGREALVQHIGDQHKAFPGSRVELTSGFSEHHGKIQFLWRFVNAEGEVVINGIDFGTLDEDGRLCQIVGFFGPPPELE